MQLASGGSSMQTQLGHRGKLSASHAKSSSPASGFYISAVVVMLQEGRI